MSCAKTAEPIIWDAETGGSRKHGV